MWFWVRGAEPWGRKADGGGARRPQSLRLRQGPPRDSDAIFVSGADSWQWRPRPTAQARAAHTALLKSLGWFFSGQGFRGSPWAAGPGGGRAPGFGSPLEPTPGPGLREHAALRPRPVSPLGRGRRSRGRCGAGLSWTSRAVAEPRGVLAGVGSRPAAAANAPPPGSPAQPARGKRPRQTERSRSARRIGDLASPRMWTLLRDLGSGPCCLWCRGDAGLFSP